MSIENTKVRTPKELSDYIQVSVQEFLAHLMDETANDANANNYETKDFCKLVGSGFFSFVYELEKYSGEKRTLEDKGQFMNNCTSDFIQGSFHKAKFLKADFLKTEEHL